MRTTSLATLAFLAVAACKGGDSKPSTSTSTQTAPKPAEPAAPPAASEKAPPVQPPSAQAPSAQEPGDDEQGEGEEENLRTLCEDFVEDVIKCAADPALLDAAVAPGGKPLAAYGTKARTKLRAKLDTFKTYGFRRVCNEFGPGDGTDETWPFPAAEWERTAVGKFLADQVPSSFQAGEGEGVPPPSCAAIGKAIHARGFPELRGD